MAEGRSNKKELRRKHCRVDLQQVVTKVRIYKRPLDFSSGKAGASLGLVHEAAVATTYNGKLYLIEKGVDQSDDINYRAKYREGECRIVEVFDRDIRDWQLKKTVTDVEPGITIEDLFESCGSEYGFLSDNCWNGTHRICARANREEDGLTWQGQAGVGVAIGIGIGLLAYAMSEKSDKKKVKNYQ